MTFFTPAERAVLEAASERLVPATPDGHPGARALGTVDYIDGLLDAFASDPPHIWAGGPYSGRAGGPPGFSEFMALSPIEELAWRTRIEGSRGIAERERMGPIAGWQQDYRDGIARLGADFASVPAVEQDRRLAVNEAFRDLLYEHTVEGAYAAPEYGGNRDRRAWTAIEFPGDVQPRGYTDAEVEGKA
ncbi:MAG: gluconate 2-dehydrogenase subunit 3 family protein [Acidimicrobiia bacterium]